MWHAECTVEKAAFGICDCIINRCADLGRKKS